MAGWTEGGTAWETDFVARFDALPGPAPAGSRLGNHSGRTLWSGGHQRMAVMGWRGEQGRRWQERECRARLSGEGRNRAAFGLQRKGKA